MDGIDRQQEAVGGRILRGPFRAKVIVEVERAALPGVPTSSRHEKCVK